MEKIIDLPEIYETILTIIALLMIFIVLILFLYLIYISKIKYAPKKCPRCKRIVKYPESYIKKRKFLFFSTIKWCIDCQIQNHIGDEFIGKK